VCETAIQVHGGIGNTWDCMAHVHLRRALLSTDLLGGVGPSLARVLAHNGIGSNPPGSTRAGGAIAADSHQFGHSARTVDFADSPDEAAFRARLREWLATNTPDLPASSTSDDYWAAQAGWHRSLYDAGFFALSWPEAIGGHELPSVYDVIVDDELAAAGAPPRPSLGYLVQGMLEHASVDVQQRFLPGLVNGTERWCQGFSEPDAGSDLASLRTRADLDGDEYVITGHKIWTSYSDVADWCLVLARTDHDVPKHKGLSAFAVPMHQPGIEQRPLKMINGITTEFGEVSFDRARVPAANMLGGPGEGWRLAMTIVSHEREPGELGYVARYKKAVRDLTKRVIAEPDRYDDEQRRELAWAIVEAEMLRTHVSRRLSDRLDGIHHGPEGSIDKLLMTWTEQAVGHAAVAVGGAAHTGGDDTPLKVYLYSRAQSVMGGTSQIQRNLVATRILGLPNS
jgi:alkylation response protein AidB-like acyl-CoA dehydrogenase